MTLGTRRSRNHDAVDISLGASNLRFWGSVMPRIFGRTCMFQRQRSKDGYPCASPRKPMHRSRTHTVRTAYVHTYIYTNVYVHAMCASVQKESSRKVNLTKVIRKRISATSAAIALYIPPNNETITHLAWNFACGTI